MVLLNGATYCWEHTANKWLTAQGPAGENAPDDGAGEAAGGASGLRNSGECHCWSGVVRRVFKIQKEKIMRMLGTVLNFNISKIRKLCVC